MRKIKILQVANVDGFVRAFLLPLMDTLEDEGYNVYIACSDTGEVKKLLDKGYKIYPVKIGRKINPVSNIKAVWNLYQLMKKGKFDIVHTHTTIAGFLGRIAAAAVSTRLVIHTMHGSFLHKNIKYWKRTLFTIVEKLIGKVTSFVFTVNVEDMRAVVEKNVIAKNNVLSLNGMGINLSRFDPAKIDMVTKKKLKEQLKIGRNDKVIGFVGRPIRKKGIFELVAAFKIVLQNDRNVKLVIVGGLPPGEPDKVSLNRLKKIVSDDNLENKILFTGMRNDIPQLISIFDLFVLPSYGEGEGFGMVLAEAAAMCKPTIVTTVPCFREVVLDGETGFLVPLRDSKRLADAILKLLNDEELAKEIGRKGRKRAEELFDEKIVLEKQLKIYKELIKSKGLSCKSTLVGRK